MSGAVGSFKLKVPDEAVATLTITMSIGDWRKLREILRSQETREWPKWRVLELISDVLAAADQPILKSLDDVVGEQS